jgi:ABC-type glycerol-3-phosphate transport system permease component
VIPLKTANHTLQSERNRFRGGSSLSAAMVSRYALRIISTVGLLGLVLVFALPFIWMLSTSLKTLPETMIFPPEWIPRSMEWGNYAQAWNSGPFFMYSEITMPFVSVAVKQRDTPEGIGTCLSFFPYYTIS